MYERVLAPTDGSGPATAALEYAGAIAAAEGATVHVLHVADGADETGVVADGREWVERAGATAVTAVRSGEPRAEILAYADEEGVDAIVVGTHGRHGAERLLFGSVAEGVVRDADVPVIVRRGDPAVEATYPFETVVAATDGSPQAERAVEEAIAVATHHDATLWVLSVVDVTPVGLDESTDLRVNRLESRAETVVAEAAAAAREAGVDDVETAVEFGSVHREIRAFVADRGADLVVAGTHGRSGVDRLLLGSVAERVLRTASTPVMTVRSATDDGAD
ncbi:universal stress protein [Halovivax sp.]|uniref:universal stress protein n=1 Tax=Halovivax sp. TaxID=1935978 RepID=UPI0025B9ED97|nr:universal stress protein [Halovivax sp.]